MLFDKRMCAWGPLATLILCLAAIFFAYQLGFSGSLYYDDYGPFSRLANVADLESALYFVSSGIAGPLGRPIALASFLPHAQDLPDNIAPIFCFNTVLHLINGVLVACITLLLLRLIRGYQPGNGWLATGVAVLWLILPLQVSTSLIAIQRMAGLSAFFVFAGLLVYLQGLSIQAERLRLGLLLQSIGLGLFTLLAMFSKENGILLPIFAWVIEFTVLAQCEKAVRWRKARLALLSAGLVAIIGYLIYYVMQGAEASYSLRQFTLFERLMTQPQILMDYLRLAFLPSTFAFSPFHDDYSHITSLLASPSALASLAAWVALLITAVVFRLRYPILAFAVLWFLAAHLLESTVIGLELYFEHRNYVALFGPCFALVWLIGRLSSYYPRIAPGGFVAYLIVQGLILVQVTSLWGDRVLAAELWFAHKPNSFRAAVNLADIYNNDQKDLRAALRILDQQRASCPHCAPLALDLQALVLSCVGESAEHVQLRLTRIEAKARDGGVFPAGTVVYLQNLHDLVKDGRCSAISWRQLENINRTALRETRFVNPQGLHMNLYNIYREQGMYSKAIAELQTAWKIRPNHAIAYPMVDLWINQEKFQEAADFAEHEMCLELPLNPILRSAARERCQSVMKLIQDAKMQSGS